MILLVIDKTSGLESCILKIKNRVKRATQDLLVLHFDDGMNSLINERLKNIWMGPIIFENVQQLYHDLWPSIRMDLIRFVKGFPFEEYSEDECFLNSFIGNGTSLWWFSELSQLNTAGNPVYWSILHAMIVKFIISERGITECFCNCNENLSNLIKQICHKKGVSTRDLGITKKNFFYLKLFKALFIVRFRNLLFLFINVIIAKLASLSLNKDSKNISEQDLLAVFTWFPRSWRFQDDKWKDLYYGIAIDEISRRDKYDILYGLRLHDNVIGINPRSYGKRVRRLREYNLPNEWRILECYDSFLEIVKHYLNFSNVVKYYSLERKKTYRNLFQFNGLNLYPILRLDMWRSVIIYWTEMLLFSKRVENFIKETQPSAVLLYCFEYIYGRAIIDAAKKSGCRVVLGMQHGPWSFAKLIASVAYNEWDHRNNLLRMQVADYYLVDSELGYQTLLEAGVPATIIHKIGPLRFEEKIQKVNNIHRKRKFGSEKVKVLVTPGHMDSERVVNFAIQALNIYDYAEIIIKLHPKAKVSFDIKSIDNITKTSNNRKYEFSEKDDLYQNFERSDIVLASYSTTALEAILIGLPIIIVLTNKRPDLSIFMGTKSSVLFASSVDEVRSHFNLLVNDTEFRNEYIVNLREEIVCKFFGNLNSSPSKNLFNVFEKVIQQ